jgi:hypothetical protein
MELVRRQVRCSERNIVALPGAKQRRQVGVARDHRRSAAPLLGCADLDESCSPTRDLLGRSAAAFALAARQREVVKGLNVADTRLRLLD